MLTAAPPPAPDLATIAKEAIANLDNHGRPLVSFVVVAYNEEHNIGRCLRAVAAQDEIERCEVIVVDDGSTDGTAAVVRAMVSELPPGVARLVRHHRNRGRGAARATGVTSSRGELVAMVDADIVIPRQWLSRCRSELRDGGWDAVGGTPVPDGDCTFVHNRFGLVPKRARPTTVVPGGNSLFRREVFQQVALDSSLREGEDVALNYAMAGRGLRLLNISDLTVEHVESKGFRQSVNWLYASGRGASRQLVRYRQVRVPDIAAAGQFAVCLTAALAARGPSRGRRWAWATLPACYLAAAALAHLALKFSLRAAPRKVLEAWGANTVLLGSYFVGRATGLPSALKRPRRPSQGGARDNSGPAPPPLRVAVVSDAVYPFCTGGKELRSFQIYSRIQATGARVQIFTMRWWGEGARNTDHGLEMLSLCRSRAMYKGPRRSIAQAFAFSLGCLKLWNVGADVIDADQIPYLPVLPVLLIAKLRRIPVLLTWHEWWGEDYWRQYLGPWGSAAAHLERALARLAPQLVVHSPVTARQLRNAGVSAERIAIVPNGVDLDLLRSAPASERRFDVLFVGRLLAHKGAHLLVEALARLRADGLRLSCGIVGEGPERPRLHGMIVGAGLSDEVALLGRVEHHREVLGLLKSAKTFALPTTREGYGLAVAEALACGTQVVTTNHVDNNAQHLVQHGVNGWLCEANVGSLTSALEKAACSPIERSSVAATGARGWDDAVSTLLRLYGRRTGALA